MATITRFEDIRVWQTARLLTRRLYQITNRGAFARDFGLRDQIRRAAVSVMSNIAEGFESDGNGQFIFVDYLKANRNSRRVRESGIAYEIDQPNTALKRSNVKTFQRSNA